MILRSRDGEKLKVGQLGNKFWFVAERRLNLARPFKAGIAEASRVASRQRRLSENFSRRWRDEVGSVGADSRP